MRLAPLTDIVRLGAVNIIFKMSLSVFFFFYFTDFSKPLLQRMYFWVIVICVTHSAKDKFQFYRSDTIIELFDVTI